MNADEPKAEAAARRTREAATLRAMITLFCHARHDTKAGLCAECADLEAYALRRLDACRYGAEKPVCAKCPTHCYAPTRRQSIREVMAYAGPRMLRRHPALAMRHLLDKMRKAPQADEAGSGDPPS
ncbi:MAG: nitrous oxide-stimulated promoter family protein [Verrucomicrobia bacterium]|nr:nitrous oxide-stimulated promoter family protein [Verrucomicrobiota bacterium]